LQEEAVGLGRLVMMLAILLAGTAGAAGERPVIRKLGTIDCDLVEATPVVFKGKLYRFEYVRAKYKPNKTGDSYFRFIDVESGEATPGFAAGYHLGCAYVEGDTVFAYGVKMWGESEIRVFWSKDLRAWRSQTALDIPKWGVYNTSVCKGRKGYVMAIELGEPPEEVGVRFTMRFAESDDLVNWKALPAECVYSKDRYTACPAIRFLDDLYYMVYLEAKPGPSYAPHIVRSSDLIHWQQSPFNPIMTFSDDDRGIANPELTPEERERIAKAVNINNSDVDLCEFEGKTVIYYSWGNQQGIEFLAEAAYDGTLAGLLRGFFR
jgi:alpha-L-fucosidase